MLYLYYVYIKSVVYHSIIYLIWWGTEGVPRKGVWASVNTSVWTCKWLRVSHNQASCDLPPPFLGTPLVPSRLRGDRSFRESSVPGNARVCGSGKATTIWSFRHCKRAACILGPRSNWSRYAAFPDIWFADEEPQGSRGTGVCETNYYYCLYYYDYYYHSINYYHVVMYYTYIIIFPDGRVIWSWSTFDRRRLVKSQRSARPPCGLRGTANPQTTSLELRGFDSVGCWPGGGGLARSMGTVPDI